MLKERIRLHLNEMPYPPSPGVVEAAQRALEAHETGVSLLLVTHQERAELYQEQFASCGLTVTIEPE